MIFLFYRLCKNLQFPQDGLFLEKNSGEEEILEESNGPSLIKVRWLAHFLFLCGRKQLSIPVYVVLSPIVAEENPKIWKSKSILGPTPHAVMKRWTNNSKYKICFR